MLTLAYQSILGVPADTLAAPFCLGTLRCTLLHGGRNACNRSIASARRRYVGGFLLAIWLSHKSDDDKKTALQEALKLLQDGVFSPQAGMFYRIPLLRAAGTFSWNCTCSTLIPALYEKAPECGMQALGSSEQRIICRLMDLHMHACLCAAFFRMDCAASLRRDLHHVCLLLTV